VKDSHINHFATTSSNLSYHEYFPFAASAITGIHLINAVLFSFCNCSGLLKVARWCECVSCVLCGVIFCGYGNNPHPLAKDDTCNYCVVAARAQGMLKK
jgi:hypothetical protein